MTFDHEIRQAGTATGIPIVDQDHEQIVHLYSGMVEVIHRKLGKEALLESLGLLTACVTDHFINEEKVMDELGCDDAGAHKKDHKRFVQRLEEFRISIEQIYREEDWPEIAEYLKYRFMQHSYTYDNQLTERHRSRA